MLKPIMNLLTPARRSWCKGINEKRHDYFNVPPISSPTTTQPLNHRIALRAQSPL
eukprot:IDg6772t1